MSPEPTRCPKCKGEMALGALVTARSVGNYRATEWLEGIPMWSFFTGLKLGGRARYPVRTDRCRVCGYLESYAKQP